MLKNRFFRFVILLIAPALLIIWLVEATSEVEIIELEEPIVLVNPDEDIIFEMTGYSVLYQAQSWEARGDEIYLILVGNLTNEQSREVCVQANKTRIFLDDEQFRPANGLMDRLKDGLERDFMGAYTGQCVAAGETQETYVAFVAPRIWEVFEISFYDEENRTELEELAEMDFSDVPSDESAILTQTASSVETTTITPSATITNTSLPTLTFTATDVPLPTVPPSSTVYYVQTQANIRDCPQVSCNLLDTYYSGAALEIINDNVPGDEFRSSTRWMQGVVNGTIFYVHSALVSRSQPAPSPVPQQAAPVRPTTDPRPLRPGNCSTAVAMGITAQQAAQWSHLDRDRDGVACYGD